MWGQAHPVFQIGITPVTGSSDIRVNMIVRVTKDKYPKTPYAPARMLSPLPVHLCLCGRVYVCGVYSVPDRPSVKVENVAGVSDKEIKDLNIMLVRTEMCDVSGCSGQ